MQSYDKNINLLGGGVLLLLFIACLLPSYWLLTASCRRAPGLAWTQKLAVFDFVLRGWVALL